MPRRPRPRSLFLVRLLTVAYDMSKWALASQLAVQEAGRDIVVIRATGWFQVRS